MDKFDIKSAKYIVAVIVICLVFFAIVGNAFKYLPKDTTRVNVNSEYAQSADDAEVADMVGDIDKDEDSYNKKEKKSGYIEDDVDYVDDEFQPDIKESQVPENNSRDTNTASDFNTSLSNADSLYAQKQFDDAVKEYKNALSATSDLNEQALCNQKISEIYARQKRYGTAIAFAQRAYNQSPNTYREMMLARLYYKAGDTDRASRMADNILKRDFAMDK